jgi:hypothetical protein
MVNQKIVQPPNKIAHSAWSGDIFTATDCVIDQGGFVHAVGAKSVVLTRVHSTGQPKGEGVYFAICATEPVENFLWDNTGLVHEIVSGDEAALRIMGGAVCVVIRNVNFRCCKHACVDAHGKTTMQFWKQAQQWRDVRKALVQGGRTIGPIDVGQQKNTALTPQRVDELRFIGHAMTHKPSVTDRSTIGIVTMQECPKIDENGNQIGMWADERI